MKQPTPQDSSKTPYTATEPPFFIQKRTRWILNSTHGRSLLGKLWGWTGFGERKLWDILQLLLLPTVLMIGAFYWQDANQKASQLAQANREKEQKVAADRAKQEILERYIDQISTLLFEKQLRTDEEGSDTRMIARAKTLTVLRDLDEQQKGNLIRFLNETKLIRGKEAIINLADADLKKANLAGINLSEINLNEANLKEAILLQANLKRSWLRETSLSGAILSTVNLSKANLTKANLSSAILSDVNLRQANLSGAFLGGAILSEVDLKQANLSNANLENAQLDPAILTNALLCDTVMPDRTNSDRDCAKLKQRK